MAEIRAFNATIQYGNFTRAAQILNVSQPAITAQIRKLEMRFSAPLLERFSKGVRPTDLGKRLYRITCQYQDLEGAIEVLSNPTIQPGEMTLRVATASPLIFMPLIAEFNQRFPDISLKINSATTNECLQMIENREVDIALCPQAADHKGLSRLSFHSHKLMAIVPNGHTLLRQDQISLRQLVNEPLIFSRPHSCTQMVLDELFSRHHLSATAHVVMDNRMEICEAVTYRLGIGFAFENDIRPDEQNYRIMPISEVDQAVVEHVVWLKNRRTLPGIRDFIQLALEKRCGGLAVLDEAV